MTGANNQSTTANPPARTHCTARGLPLRLESPRWWHAVARNAGTRLVACEHCNSTRDV